MKILFWLNEHFNLLRKVYTLNDMAKGYAWTPAKIVEDKATVDELKFTLNEAKERVKVLTDDAEKLYQRSLILISFSITSLITVVGYIGVNFVWERKTIILAIIGFCLLVVTSILKNNIVTERYLGVGSKPDAYLAEDFYSVPIDTRKTIEWWFLFDLNMAYNDRIELDSQKNDARAVRIKKAVIWLFRIPVLVAVGILVCLITSIN